MGHLTRALALARRAVRRGVSVQIISNSPLASALANPRCRQLVDWKPGIELIPIPVEGRKAEVTRRVHCALREAPPADVLVVDTFPRGLAGELPDLLAVAPSFKVLVHRRLNPDYVRWGNLESFAAHYDLVLVPGEEAAFAHLPRALRTDPWLISTADEILPAALARAALGVDPLQSLPVVVVVGSGKPDETLAAATAATNLANRAEGQALVRFITCDEQALAAAGTLGCSLWPILPLHAGIDLLIGAGGYNTVHEARATGTRLVAVPQPRLYDQQASRLLPHESAADWNSAIDRALQILNSPTHFHQDPCTPFLDGADQAARAICEKAGSRLSAVPVSSR